MSIAWHWPVVGVDLSPGATHRNLRLAQAWCSATSNADVAKDQELALRVEHGVLGLLKQS
jgi:IS5 family transposase